MYTGSLFLLIHDISGSDFSSQLCFQRPELSCPLSMMQNETQGEFTLSTHIMFPYTRYKVICTRQYTLVSFRISGYFPSFRRSAFPSFRIWGDFPPFRHSAIPSFRIWGYFPPFHDSVIPPFHRSVIPAFRVAVFAIRIARFFEPD